MTSLQGGKKQPPQDKSLESYARIIRRHVKLLDKKLRATGDHSHKLYDSLSMLIRTACRIKLTQEGIESPTGENAGWRMKGVG